MESYWPTVLTDPNASPRDLAHARWVDTISKIVFSRTLFCGMEAYATGERSDCGRDRTLKQEPGQDLMIFGSPGLTHACMHLDLIDEYRLFLNPIVLGGGIPLPNLRLAEAQTVRGEGVPVRGSRHPLPASEGITDAKPQ